MKSLLPLVIAVAVAPHARATAQDASSPEELREFAVPATPITESDREVTDATVVASRMKKDPEVASLLQRARAVFIIPDYGKAAAGLGVRAGEGVVLVKQPDGWSNPAFYSIGAITAGPQAGVAAGSIALIFMSEKAERKLRDQDSFALDLSSGMTVVHYSAASRTSARGDVVLWSDTEGAFAGASIGVARISRDEEQTRAFYGPHVTAAEVLAGKIDQEKARSLRYALSARAAPD